MTNNKKSIVVYNSGPLEGDSLETRPIGGSEIAVISMMRELARLGYRTTIISNCTTEGLFHGINFFNLTKAESLLKNEMFDIFISQSNTEIFKLNINAPLKLFWTGAAPRVRSMQALSDEELRDKINFFFFVSNWQANGFKTKFNVDEKKIFITKNGFDPLLFEQSPSKVKYRLIYFSSPDRGLDILLEVFPKIKRRFKETELYIFSDYEFYNKPKGTIKKEHPDIFKRIDQPGVRYFGNINHEDLVNEVKKAYIIAYPAHFEETSCMAAIEAQAAGTPPVTSKLAALSETVENGKTGILIPGNSRSIIYKWRFIRAIFDLFKNEEKWKALSEAGKNRMIENYSWKKITSEWDRFFKEKLHD